MMVCAQHMSSERERGLAHRRQAAGTSILIVLLDRPDEPLPADEVSAS